MPECIASWIRYKDPTRIARIQQELVQVYEHDFSKYNGKVNSGHILMVFRSITTQLAKEHQKFMYWAAREGGRARDFEEAIEWLVSAGLLKHMAGIDNSAILLKTDYQFKGALMENYVLQQLKGQFQLEPRYFSDKRGEIDFVVQHGTEIIPIEVKGGEDKSAPSFKHYVAERMPEHVLGFSRRGYVVNGRITNLPLYLARKTRKLLRGIFQDNPSNNSLLFLFFGINYP